MLSYLTIPERDGKKSILFAAILCILFCNPFISNTVRGQTVLLNELKAFPTAEGYGKHVTGGNDGIVLKVTNLNDRGSGSLRAALEDSRPATIVFEVAGTILLNSSIVSKSNKTVAGETAFRNGGQGISIRLNPDNVFSTPLIDTGGNTRGAFGNHIWRYIRFRRGQGEPGENSGDNFSPWGNAGSFIIDHCSFMFSTDQNVSFPSVDGYTVQNSISAFGLAYATHSYGTKHSKGSLTSDTPYCTWYRNLFSCNDDRNPLIQAKTSGITRVELINNFMYNRGIFGVQFQTYYGGTFHADIVGNYFKDGPNSKLNRWGFMWPGETTVEANNTQYYRNPQWAAQRVYVSGNLGPRRTSHSQEDWDFLGAWDDNSNAPQSSKAQHEAQSRLNDGVASSVIIPAEDLQSKLLPDVGVSLYYDTFDAQAISFAINGTGSLVNGNGFSGGGFPEVSTLGPNPTIRDMSSVPADGNDDGIDDDWADAHDISNAQQIKATYDFGDYQVLNNAGYTALEIYLAYLAKDFDRMDKGDSNASIPVTDVTVNADILELDVRKMASLTATVSPSDATNGSVIWSSSDTAIATVDQSGNVTALTAGAATIMATSFVNGEIYDSAALLVTGGEPTELWLEAECADVGANWNMIEDATASGGRYLLSATGNYLDEAPSDDSSIISYNFTASTGIYAIYARTFSPSQEADSFWVRLNRGPWLRWNKIPSNDGFGWNRVHEGTEVGSPINFDIPQGENTLQIAQREEGARLDKVFVTNTGTVPSGFGQTDLTCAENIPVESVTIGPENLDLEIASVHTLAVNVLPINATVQSVTWATSDNTIARVDQHGNVIAISEGTVSISATANDGSNVSNVSVVSVGRAPNILVDDITINPQEIDLEIDQVRMLSLIISPINATDRSVTWSSSDDTIATVNEYGNLIAVAEGSATITAIANDGSEIMATSEVFISPMLAPNVLVDSLALDPEQLDMEINEIHTFVATLSPTNATNQSLTWTSSDETIVTVDQNGKVTAMGEGDANITVMANDSTHMAFSSVVSVSPIPDILLETITISPQQLDLEINQVQTLAMSLSPTNATNQGVTWTSDNNAIARVDQNGMVTALAEGSATITVTANDGSNVSNTAPIIVRPVRDILVTTITVSPQELDLEINEVEPLNLVIAPLNATDQSVAWSSSDIAVATVDHSGNVTAIAEGNVTITAAANDASATFGSVDVIISAAVAQTILVEYVSISPQQIELEMGQTGNLTATISPADPTDRSITWTSNNNAVATVDQNGKITAVTIGSAVITANANDFGGASATAQISVYTSEIAETTELWLEAECANVGSKWDVMDDATASSGKYLLFSSGNNSEEGPSDTNGIISYEFTVVAGTYIIYARAKASSDTKDSFWVRMNGAEWMLWDQITSNDSFQWNQIKDVDDANRALSFNLLEGTNTFEIAAQEDGMELDKIFITNSTYQPNGLGLESGNCSSRSTDDNAQDNNNEQEDDNIQEDDIVQGEDVVVSTEEELPSPDGIDSIEELIIKKISAFPNPTRGDTMITFTGEKTYSIYSIYTVSGVLMKQGNIEDGQNQLPISLEGMKSGMYLIRFTTDSGEEDFEKIMKN